MKLLNIARSYLMLTPIAMVRSYIRNRLAGMPWERAESRRVHRLKMRAHFNLRYTQSLRAGDTTRADIWRNLLREVR